MSGKNYTMIKTFYLKAIQNIKVSVGEIKIDVSKEIQKAVKSIIQSIKKNNNLKQGQKEDIIHKVYQTVRDHAINFNTSGNMQLLVQEFIKSKFLTSFKDHMDKFKNSTLKQEINTAISTKEELGKSDKTEEKKDEFTELKNSVLKSLGYVQGQRGSQDNSTEKWMLANTGEGISRTTRNFWIDDVRKISNIGALNAFLKKNRLIIKDGHLLRGR